MTILLLAPGGWVHGKRTAEAVLREGHEVYFLDEENPYPEGRTRFHFLRMPRTGRRLYAWFLSRNQSRRVAEKILILRLSRLWKRLRADAVHVCWADERAYFCAMAGMRPLIISAWGTDINRCFFENSDAEQNRRIGRALAVAACTVIDAKDIGVRCNTLAGKDLPLRMLHLGVDTSRFRSGYGEERRRWRQQLAIGEGTVALLSMRILQRRYNHHLVLEAFARALGKSGGNAVLLFKRYCVDEDYQAELKTRAAQLGILEQVQFLEDQPFARLHECYALADVIVNFPQIDAFPVTFLEAASSERPLISCRLPSYEGTFAAECFTMVEPESVPELGDAMAAMIADVRSGAGSLRDRVAAAKSAVGEFDESKYGEGLTAIYRAARLESSGRHLPVGVP